MTRQDFIDGITTWSELIDFCYNEDCDICEDIIDSDEMDEEISDNLSEEARECSWRDIRDALNDITTGYSYYRRDGSFDYVPMDDSDFDSYKDDVIEWMDNGGYWDDEENYDDEPFYDEYSDFNCEENEEDAEITAVEEDFSVGELMGMCSVQFLGIQREAAQRRKQTDRELEQYLSNMPKVLQ